MTRASTNQIVVDEPDESAPLLPDVECEGGFKARGPTPLPKVQLGVLVAVRMVDPIAYTQIFPYINQLLADLCVAAPEQVGFYSGLIESAYSLAQVFSVYQWGRLSDTIGRRPVLILGLVGIMVTTLGFGWSTSLAAILASRFLGGLVAGNIAVLHSMLVEMTDDTNQNVAVPIYGLSWSTGTVIGPLIGGTFANAATQYPKYFSWPIFVDHSYLPPCIISAACALLGVGLGCFLIEETLPGKRKGSTSGVARRKPSSASDANPGSAKTGLASVKTLLAIPALRALTLSGFALSFLSSAFDAVFTLFCYTPIDAGGLGFQPSTIGTFLTFAGTFAILLRLAVMPYALRRFDYAAIYNVCMYLWPATFLCLPLLNALARASVPAHHEVSPATSARTGIGFGFGFGTAKLNASASASDDANVGVWIGLALVLAVSKVAAIPYSITMLLIKRYALPSGTSTGVTDGMNGTSANVGSGANSAFFHGENAPGSHTPGTGTGIRRAMRTTRTGMIATETETGMVARAGRGTMTGSVSSAASLGQSNGLVQFAMCIGRALGPVTISALFTVLNGAAPVRRWGGLGFALGWAWAGIMAGIAVVGARLTRRLQ